jgi:hypothetical protein
MPTNQILCHELAEFLHDRAIREREHQASG